MASRTREFLKRTLPAPAVGALRVLNRISIIMRQGPAPFPVTLATDPERRSRGRILVVAYFDPAGIHAVTDNIALTAEYSVYHVDLINLHGYIGLHGMQVPPTVQLDDYDGLLIHSTVSYQPENLRYLDHSLRTRFRDYRGVKMMMKQDEQNRYQVLTDYLAANRFDALLTCLPARHWRDIYPASLLPDLCFVQTMTGYVTDQMRELGRTATQEERDIDIGYRGSRQQLHYGMLCWEKQAIGDFFQDVGRHRGLRTDISSRAEDRLTGDAWFTFLLRCRATLGVESGASIFDPDGGIAEACADYQRRHPDADFSEIHRAVLAPHEGRVHYNQVSPRHFEAAACRTLQILYEGGYSGILLPWRHYVPLRRDHANLDEVLAVLSDQDRVHEITDCAFDEIILNPAYHYRHYARLVDDEFTKLIARKRSHE